MNSSHNISLKQTLREVRPLAGAPAKCWDEFLAEREQAAHELGRQEAEKAFAGTLAAERARLAEHQKGILSSLQNAVPQVVQGTEGALMRLAVAAAQKVVGGMPISAEMVEAVVREALDQVGAEAEVVVQLHPEDLALLCQHESSLLAQNSKSAVKFIESQEIKRGDCVVRTKFGSLDASREVKFNQLYQALSE